MAAKVTILTIDSDRNPGHYGDDPGTNLAEHLTRHGATVEVAKLSSDGSAIADVILNQAAAQNADLLIIGAYSHPRTTRSEEHTSELQSLMRISYAVF